MENQTTAAAEEDHISKLPDDVLVHILSLCPYPTLMRTVSVSTSWQRLLSQQLPNLTFCLSLPVHKEPSMETPSEERVQSMARTLRRRCHGTAADYTIKNLRLVYRKDVAMECRYVDEFIALANATKLELVPHIGAESFSFSSADEAGDWSVELPPATVELEVQPFCIAVRPPRIHGPGVNALRSLTLFGLVVREDFPLAVTLFPSLEDLHIGNCTLAASMTISSDTMPRLKHLRFTEVSVSTDDTKAAITVLADDLRTLRMSCRGCSYTESPSERLIFMCVGHDTALFTKYSLFRLRAPKLVVFEWRCCYADEVRVDAVGRLSDVAIEIADR
uniref:F-box domain containing protein n=1 Tax=Zea mays TaxID=4577 RepID=B6TBN2_MAIZE|nr:F-box domain containing protein [Zea mays]|eukprot:NP_001149196.1 F-box domain containing protein [Zea mays]